MTEGEFSVGEFHLSTEPKRSPVSEFVKKERDYVDGTALIYNVTGPHDLSMQIHYVELENGDRLVRSGRAYNGPKWIFGQLYGRLTITVNKKPQGHVLDLTLPRPKKGNESLYTASMASKEDLEGIHPDVITMMQEMGAREVGARSDVIDDASTHRRKLCVLMDDPGGLVPVIAYFLTRTIAISRIFENLLSSGDIDDESVSHYAKNTQPSGQLEAMIAEGDESNTFELKSSVWATYNGETGERFPNSSKNLKTEDSVIKTIAAFLNSEGGKLIIGVQDRPQRRVVGIEADFEYSGHSKDIESFQNGLSELIRTATRVDSIVGTNGYIQISIEEVEGKAICVVDVTQRQPKEWTWVDVKTMEGGLPLKEAFFVRSGPQTKHLKSQASAHEWRTSRMEN
jgi:hypothetical protein